VLPLQFHQGEGLASLGLTGREAYTIRGVDTLEPHARLQVVARSDEGAETTFEVVSRIDGPIELDYYRNGGILPAVLRRIARESSTT
jgi:aconitate hydratase